MKTHPELKKLRDLVVKTWPNRTDHKDLTMRLWKMIGALMVHADMTRVLGVDSGPEGKLIASELQPFASFLLQPDCRVKGLRILNEFLLGKKFELPYGTIAVDKNGIVTMVKVKYQRR